MSYLSANDEGRARPILRAASLSLVGQAYFMALSILSGLVIAGSIGPASYGVFSLVRTICESVALIGKSGLDLGMVRFLGERHAAEDRALTTAVSLRVLGLVGTGGVMLGCLIWLGADAIQDLFFPHADFSRSLELMAYAIPGMMLVQVMAGIARGYGYTAPRVLGELMAQPTFRLGLFLMLVPVSPGVVAASSATLLSFAVVTVGLGWWMWRQVLGPGPQWVDGERVAWLHVQGVARYSVVLSGSVLMAFLAVRIDLVILGYYVTAAELGQYAIAQMLASLLSMFNLALAQGAAPIIAGLASRGDRDGLARVMAQHGRWVAMATAPLFFALVLYGPGLLTLIDPGYRTSGWTLLLLAAAQLVVALFSSAGYTLSMTGRHVAEFRVLGAATLAGLGLNVVLVPSLGLEGAAASGLVAALLANLVRGYLVQHAFGVRVLTRDAIRPLFVAAAVFGFVLAIAAALGLSAKSPLVASALVTVSICLYALVTLTYRLNPDDRVLVASLVARVRRGAGMPT